MFPLADVLEFRVDADVYRVAVGMVELVCGAILAVIPGSTSSRADYSLDVTLCNKETYLILRPP